MEAWIYQSALLCGECAIERRVELNLAVVKLADEEGDYDIVPQGPFPDGGGEADCPQHCDHCGIHLENPLTADGYEYVRDMARDPDSHTDTIRTWRAFYDI